MEPRLLTIPEVMEALRLSRSSVYQLLDSGRLRSVHVGRLRRIRTDDLDTFLSTL